MKASSRILDANERTTRAACAEVDAGLRAGSIPGAEAMFAKYPSLAGDAEAALEVIFTEYLTRESLGRPNEPAGYYERFPQWRDRLERLFQVDELLKDDADPAGGTGTIGGTGTTARIAGDSRRFIPADGVPTKKGVAGYQLIEKLGSGGMGVVYKAVQPGLKRVVALKLLRHGSEASAAVLARFRREAELTARLRHPNIVPVYDVGEANGEPYLAMEFVAGGTLRDRLQNKILPAAEAARLVEKLARAVDYAHGQNVVHRDLKPGNILLDGPETGSGTEQPTLLDSRSTPPPPPPVDLSPKIADFGLAIGRDQSSGLTRQGQILGTPSYMAPEQASGRSDDAEPGVDTYALGAILYECLTGRPPFLAETELETLRQVTEQDPVRPRDLLPNTPRDLETVCLKCLHKDPAKRYASAGLLADDLGRFRTGDAILARPTGTVERAVKWVRRHPTATITAGVGLFAVVAGLVLSAQYAAHLKVARDGSDLDAARAIAAAKVADEERVRAVALAEKLKDSLAAEERQRQQARAILDRVSGEVIDQWYVKLPQLSDQQREFLNRLVGEYELLAQESAADPAAQIALARAHRRVGEIRLVLGESKEARASFLKSEAIFSALPAPSDVAGERADLLESLGAVAERENRIQESIQYRTRALVLSERILAGKPGDRPAEYRVMKCLNVLARAVIINDRPREARTYLNRAKALIEKSVWMNYESFRIVAAGVEDAIGQSEWGTGQPRNAEDHYRAALKFLELLGPGRSDSFPATHLAARIEVNLSAALSTRPDGLNEALERAASAESRLEGLVAAYPGYVKYRHDLGIARNAIGNAFMELNQYDKAEAPLARAIEAYRGVLRDSPTFASINEVLGGTYCNLGIVYRVNGNVPAALDAFDKGWEILDAVLKAKPSATGKQYAINTAWNRARTLSKRAIGESGSEREQTIGECLDWLKTCQTVSPLALKPLMNTMTRNADWASLRDDERGGAFLESLKGK